MDNGWPRETSPFHAGEQEVQRRVGVHEKVETFARRMVRDYLPPQHREFYAQLPFLLVGATDDAGRCWAGLLAGPPGFVSSPDPRLLRVDRLPVAADPLAAALQVGRPVGILGIQLETRRRNRATGRVTAVDAAGFTLAIDQAFGNCPQYIQTRTVKPGEAAPAIGAVQRGDRLDAAARALVERSDTLFIATATRDAGDDPVFGADVSHRGGRPGFVRVDADDATLTIPDFAGNLHFNTLGNIAANPRAGLLFIDFATGDSVSLTGSASVVWSGEEVEAFAGAERLIRIRIEEMRRIEVAVPLRFVFGEASPFLEATGSWAKAGEIIDQNRQRSTWTPFDVVQVRQESETITSFYLRRTDGEELADYEAGQFLPIRLTLPGDDAPTHRTYTLSAAPNREWFRLSVKREDGAAGVSAFLHDHAKPGFRLEAMAPRGKFVLTSGETRPVVLLSGGVGITPMVAMAQHLINEGRRTGFFRRIFFIHGAIDGRRHAFGPIMRELAAAFPSLTVHVRYSRPGPEDRLGIDYDSEGHVDVALLKAILPFDDFDFYLCGPASFMRSLHDGLVALGIREERIHGESFGPAMLLKKGRPAALPPRPGTSVDGPVRVRFKASGIDAEWSPDRGTLLELAEAAGLTPPYSCRSGVCGTCATTIACGTVDYVEEPVAQPAVGEVLICCATPRSNAGPETCGGDYGVILDL